MSEAALSKEKTIDPVRFAMGAEPTPRWTMRTVVLATLIAVAIGLAFLLLYRFYMIVFLFFVAFSLATALKPTISWLQKHNIPPLFGILPLYFIFIGLVVGFLWFLAPTISSQLMTVVQDLPEYYDELRLYLSDSPNEVLHAIGSLMPVQLVLPVEQLSATTETEPMDPLGLVGQLLSNVGKIIFMVIAVFLLVYYWLIEGDRIVRRAVLRIRVDRRDEVRLLLAEIENKIGGYFRGQLLLCLIIGLLSLVAFLILDVPNALTLALISGVTEAVPILGPTLGAIPAILMTLTTDPEKTIWVVVALVIIQSLENNFLVPRVMDRSVGVNPLITILAIAAFGLLFGFVGAILAIPLAAILQILLTRLLFNPSPAEEASLLQETEQPARDRIAVLRLEAQELAQDVRKQARQSDRAQLHDAQIEQAEDMIEALAGNLESFLVQRERAV